MSETFSFAREAPPSIDLDPPLEQLEEYRNDGYDLEYRIQRRNNEGKAMITSSEEERKGRPEDPKLVIEDIRSKREWLADYYGIGTPEEFEGDLYIARERQKSKPPLDRLEVQTMRDQQFDVDDESEETLVIRANAQKACAACPGHCCRAFTMAWWPMGEGDLERRIQEIRVLLGYEVFQRPEMTQGLPDRYKSQPPVLTSKQRAEAEEVLFTYEFFKKNLVTLEADRKVFTCKAFNPAARRCEAYEERPLLCRRFICGPATTGVPPDMGRMLSEQPRIQEILDRIQG